jgi:tetratricopeptide (TPR) repeat protein
MIASLLVCLLARDADQAVQAYRAGDFAAALALFQTALSERGAPDGALLYDLGNCAYRLGHHAEALLYYRRAELRLPRDRELAFNRRLAEEQLGLESDASQSFGAGLLALPDAFTSRELLVLVTVLETAGLVGLVLLRRRRVAPLILASIVLLALAGAVRLVQREWFAGLPDGLVIENEIALRAEPRVELPVTAKLRAGETVSVEALADPWIRIRHARGSGWTPRKGVGLVD